jgi:glycolate oxidase
MKDRALSEQLLQIVGADGLVDDPDELLVYECDAYTLEKNPPTAVVFPRTTE